jgi:hypothetical protein
MNSNLSLIDKTGEPIKPLPGHGRRRHGAAAPVSDGHNGAGFAAALE